MLNKKSTQKSKINNYLSSKNYRKQNTGAAKLTSRTCEICSSGEQENIHRQHFLFPGLTHFVHYDVVTCRVCGFAFASNIPDQSTLDQFYQASGHHLHASLPPGLQRIHTDFFNFVHQHIPLAPDERILDIGSGMGHFLHHFQNAGHELLLGLEPSVAAAELARKTYGLEVRSGTIDTFATSERFGLISLCGVLEHIADLRCSMAKITGLLKEDGYLFIAVPDASSFGQAPPSEPFLEFALEHINFFSATSLDTLLCTSGFEKVSVVSQHNDFYNNCYLLALYRRTPRPAAQRANDTEAASSLRAYVHLSQKALQPVEELVAQFEKTREPLLIWGAGALTSRLLSDTRLGHTNICAIIDRNTNLQGKKLLNIPITAPESVMQHADATVFIASTTYAMEIRKTLLQQYRWGGRIISLTPESTA